MKRIAYYFAIVVLTANILFNLTGCKKKDGVSKEEELPFTSIGSVSNLPGFGKSDAEAEGTPFKLPNGLRLVSRPNHPFDPDLSKLFGNINTFYVDINIVRDAAWGGGFVEFPPGLIMMHTGESKIQNGMLLDRVRINVPPFNSANDDPITIYLGVACINSSKGFPWEDNQEPDTRNYVIGKGTHMPSVVATNPEVLKFLSLLENKPHLKVTKHLNPLDTFEPDYVAPEWMKPYSAIQAKLWEMTDGYGLTETSIRELLDAIKSK